MKRFSLALLIAACVVGLLAFAVGTSGQTQRGARTGPLFAVLLGANEIGQDGRRNAGDRDGKGSFSGVFDGNELCFGITVRDLDEPVAAHIHRGTRKVNGPIVVTLVAPSEGDPGASSGCVEVEQDLANRIRRSPRRFYVNVHTEAFPGGALRGQLFSRHR